jgi:hypothetical protein
VLYSAAALTRALWAIPVLGVLGRLRLPSWLTSRFLAAPCPLPAVAESKCADRMQVLEGRQGAAGTPVYPLQPKPHLQPTHHFHILLTIPAAALPSLQPPELTTGWMLTSYLDSSMRISRDEAGHLCIMLRAE